MARGIRRGAHGTVVEGRILSEIPTRDELAALARFDTPTICNALELVMPERRALGFNRRPLIAPLPVAAPVVGFARTVMIRSREPYPRGRAEAREKRLRYYEYIAQAPLPSLCVMQDVDGADAGFGCFWGEVQSNLHKAPPVRGARPGNLGER